MDLVDFIQERVIIFVFIYLFIYSHLVGFLIMQNAHLPVHEWYWIEVKSQVGVGVWVLSL